MMCAFRTEKKTFIRAKYEKHRYAIVTCTNQEDRRQDLKQAVLSRDVWALLQVWAEGVDFMHNLPDMVSHLVSCILHYLSSCNSMCPIFIDLSFTRMMRLFYIQLYFSL